MDTETKTAVLTCKRCHSDRIIKSGVLQGNQRYQCKDCGCVFIANSAPLHGRLPVPVLVDVMESFFKGLSLDSIRTSLEDSQGLPATVAGLEKVIYRFARKALRLAENIIPRLHPIWILDTAFINGPSPICLLDVLDPDSGFIIASDVLPQHLERDRESVVKKAFRVSGSLPQKVLIGPGLLEYAGYESDESPLETGLSPHKLTVLSRYQAARNTRTLLAARRLNFDSLSNLRFICSAWRVHYNFLSGFKPARFSDYNSWLDIINAVDISTDLY